MSDRPDLDEAASILQAGGFKITGGKYAPKKPDQNTDNSKGGESARFKPTNSPESESLAYPEGSSSIPDLREQILETAQGNFDAGEYITDGGDWRRFFDDIIAIITARKAALLDKIEGLIPEKATETNSLGKHYTGYSKGYNDVIDELRTEIAKLRKGEA